MNAAKFQGRDASSQCIKQPSAPKQVKSTSATYALIKILNGTANKHHPPKLQQK